MEKNIVRYIASWLGFRAEIKAANILCCSPWGVKIMNWILFRAFLGEGTMKMKIKFRKGAAN